MLPGVEVQLLQNLQSTLEKEQQKQKFQNQKKSHRNLVVKQKSTEEKINTDPKAPKMSLKSSNQLKLVPEKLRNYFIEQDEGYFSSQETDDVIVSGKSQKN